MTRNNQTFDLGDLLYPFIVAAIASLFYYLQFENALNGEGAFLIIMLAMIGPIVWACLLLSSSIFEVSSISPIVSPILIGLEIAAIIFGGRVLLQWYLTPDNGHLEPLFVTIGVSMAALEYVRRINLWIEEDVGVKS